MCVCVCAACLCLISPSIILLPLQPHTPWRLWHSFVSFLSHKKRRTPCHCLWDPRVLIRGEERWETGVRRGGTESDEREWQGHCCKNPTGASWASNFQPPPRFRSYNLSLRKSFLAGSWGFGRQPMFSLRCRIHVGKKNNNNGCTSVSTPAQQWPHSTSRLSLGKTLCSLEKTSDHSLGPCTALQKFELTQLSLLAAHSWR